MTLHMMLVLLSHNRAGFTGVPFSLFASFLASQKEAPSGELMCPALKSATISKPKKKPLPKIYVVIFGVGRPSAALRNNAIAPLFFSPKYARPLRSAVGAMQKKRKQLPPFK
jgi:hypothetical protein